MSPLICTKISGLFMTQFIEERNKRLNKCTLYVSVRRKGRNVFECLLWMVFHLRPDDAVETYPENDAPTAFDEPTEVSYAYAVSPLTRYVLTCCLWILRLCGVVTRFEFE